jgi:tartrate-resistant acid phosphatase type 5
MGRVGEKLHIDLVVSTGDFYDTRLTGVHDDAFEQSFMDIYTANSL